MIHELSITDTKYPSLLKTADNAPETLYMQSRLLSLDGIFDNCLAVVGSRNMTAYGRKVITSIVEPLASAGITIVSGFMYGVDATAHQAALNVGGKTVAVMASGCDVICPSHQRKLYRRIEQQGVILSEYPKGFTPKKWSFSKRNRIVAGLSKAVLVIEASLNSGSLITAEYAQKYRRKVFAVPGNILSGNSLGIYHLIENGASIVTSPSSVLDFYQFSSYCDTGDISSFGSNQVSLKNLDSVDKKIVEVLSRESLNIDDLAKKLQTPQLSFSQLSAKLMLLCLSDVIKDEGGRFYAN